MTAKDELAALVPQLDDDDAAEVLAYARWLVAEGVAGWRRAERQRACLNDLPAMWRRDEQVPQDRP